MKVFISQPMKGRTDEEIQSERKKIIKKIKEDHDGVKIIDNVIKDTDDDCSRVCCLSESIKLLSEADAAYFAEGWKDADGCVIEHMICEKYDIEILEDDDDGDERKKEVQKLIDDEEEAIKGYEDALEIEYRPSVIKAYKNIIADEKRHKAMLEEIKSGRLEAMALYGLEDRHNG